MTPDVRIQVVELAASKRVLVELYVRGRAFRYVADDELDAAIAAGETQGFMEGIGVSFEPRDQEAWEG